MSVVSRCDVILCGICLQLLCLLVGDFRVRRLVFDVACRVGGSSSTSLLACHLISFMLGYLLAPMPMVVACLAISPRWWLPSVLFRVIGSLLRRRLAVVNSVGHFGISDYMRFPDVMCHFCEFCHRLAPTHWEVSLGISSHL